jgi:hypothetical protein
MRRGVARFVVRSPAQASELDARAAGWVAARLGEQAGMSAAALRSTVGPVGARHGGTELGKARQGLTMIDGRE